MKLNTLLKQVCIGLALVAGGLNGLSADKKVPTVSVAPTDQQGVANWQAAMGPGLAQMFVTELSKLDNLQVLESLALNDLRAERALGENGEVAQSESVKKGQFLGADYTLLTTVTRFGAKEKSYGGGGWGLPGLAGLPGGSVRINKSEHEVQIDWRFIDNATRAIVKGASGRGIGMEKGSGFDFSTWHGNGFSDNREFLDSALGKATMKALNQIMADIKRLNLAPGARTLNNEKQASAEHDAKRAIKGTVKMVDGNEIWVSLGANNGYAKGDKVKIYKPVEKKNTKGEVIAVTYELAGEMTLTKVQKDKSVGQFTGTAKVCEDWAVVDAAVDIETLE